MKTIIVFSFVLCGLLSHAQTVKHDLLTKHVWTLKSSGMAGIGIHKPLPKGSELSFYVDGKWKSSSPWENSSEGTWSIVNEGRTLRILFSDKTGRDFRIDKLTEEEMRWESKKLAAVYIDAWVASRNN